MSTRNNKMFPKVIVRSWGDEPVALVAHGIQKTKNRVLVAQLRAKRPISLPVSDVFDYEERRFQELQKAYVKGDLIRLKILYGDLIENKNVKSYCDTCCNVVDSLHEKPQVTNTRGVADSG